MDNESFSIIIVLSAVGLVGLILALIKKADNQSPNGKQESESNDNQIEGGKQRMTDENVIQSTDKMDERVVKLLEAQNEKLFEVTTLLKGIRLGIFLIILLAFGIPWIISTFF